MKTYELVISAHDGDEIDPVSVKVDIGQGDWLTLVEEYEAFIRKWLQDMRKQTGRKLSDICLAVRFQS